MSLRILRFVNCSIDFSCIAPLTPAVMVMRGLVFHPLALSVVISGSYLVYLCVRACSGNLSWQYVSSMSCTVWLGEGSIGGCVWLVAPIMHIMSGLSLA